MDALILSLISPERRRRLASSLAASAFFFESPRRILYV
jgi:hypothetical protein